jgi:hypothetical protein
MDNGLDRSYISEFDKFLFEYDWQHPKKSLSQQEEIDKHRKVFEKRDSAEMREDDI